MFFIQLPSHPWQGGQQMPAKWLGPICVLGKFYKRVWNIIEEYRQKTDKLFRWCSNFGTVYLALLVSNYWVLRTHAELGKVGKLKWLKHDKALETLAF